MPAKRTPPGTGRPTKRRTPTRAGTRADTTRKSAPRRARKPAEPVEPEVEETEEAAQAEAAEEETAQQEAAAEEAAEQAEPRAGSVADGAARFTVDLAGGVEEAFKRLRVEAEHLLKRGRHTRVRISFRGKELATLPLGVVVAAEAATFWWAGILRLLLVNVVGKAFLEVEIINEADGVVAVGKQRLLDGELDGAIEKFREAVSMDREHAPAQLNLGIALKLKGDRDAARAAFERAAQLDPSGDTGREARRQLEQMSR